MNKSRRMAVFSTVAGFSGLIATLASKSAQAENRSHDPELRQLRDRAEIIDAVNIIGMGADLREWKACRAAFADRVLTDYTSLNGGTPNTVAADTLISGWADFFSKTFKTTHHIIGNHAIAVNGDNATCTSLFQAHHVYLDGAKGKTWTLGGVYNHKLTRINGRWKVAEMKMTWTWEDGTRPG